MPEARTEATGRVQLYGVMICGVVPLAHAAHVVACGRVVVCSAPMPSLYALARLGACM